MKILLRLIFSYISCPAKINISDTVANTGISETLRNENGFIRPLGRRTKFVIGTKIINLYRFASFALIFIRTT